jgi:L-lactate dehydrogenase complex protein LldG
MREAVLGDVRRALSGTRLQPEVERADVLAPPTGLPTTDLIERFVARAAAVQATPCVVTSIDEARRRVAAILEQVGARHVVVSGDAWGPPWDIASLPGERGDRRMRATASIDTGTRDEAVRTADAGVTGVAHAIAETGTLVVCSGSGGGRLESLVPPVHVALLHARDIVGGVRDAFALLRQEQALIAASAVTFVTGPSRTADIEFTLTIGVHGPRQLFIVVLRT